ncbi:HxlR family transcriptional regulator [Xylanibacillus composti]|uniref:MarR family transcriptional regulator n=1 Tax=Xylanibacillus composti TaxID=1572762 RepID=A0A8J4M2F7_9BACL|nr:winged helix-turn-helix transcriptional regulator [Xylanibacillus composti]MDT9724829.1 HxlR family transcriptional regulator [Xylanibacillus composti]GIQ69080.1 MarR family transcriptional regulator [Xylanibacillus composti]
MEHERPECCRNGVKASLDIIMGKWKPIILLHLLHGGTKRFGELQRLLPDITQKMLTTQLRELEQQDIIKRKVYAEVPPKVEYSITEYGRSLYNVLQEMYEWGTAHLEHMTQKKMNIAEKQ